MVDSDMAYDILVPPLGQTTDTVVLATWYRHEGDPVVQGEPLFAIETDKATLDIEAPASGLLISVSAAAGDLVSVLSVIGRIGEKSDAETQVVSKVDLGVQPASNLATKSVVPMPHSVVEKSSRATLQHGDHRLFISPRARRSADAMRLPWESVVGTGPEGAIVERDVLAAKAALPDTHLGQSVVATISPVTSTISTAVPVKPPSLCKHLAVEVNVSALSELVTRLNRRGTTNKLSDFIAYTALRNIQSAFSDVTVTLAVAGWQGKRIALRVIDIQALKSLHAFSRITVPSLTNSDQQDMIPGNGVAVAYVDLDRFGLDTADHLFNEEDIVIFTSGRTHRHSENSTSVLLTLGYTPTHLSDQSAVQLMQAIVGMVEDPDLLF